MTDTAEVQSRFADTLAAYEAEALRRDIGELQKFYKGKEPFFVIAHIDEGFLQASYVRKDLDEALALAYSIHVVHLNSDNEEGYVVIESGTLDSEEPNIRIAQWNLDDVDEIYTLLTPIAATTSSEVHAIMKRRFGEKEGTNDSTND